MSISDRFKKMLNIDNEYFDDVDTDAIGYDSTKMSNSGSSRGRSVLGYQDRRREVSDPSPSSTKVVDIHTTAKLQVVLKKPEHFDEATTIADELLEKRTVVLNLEFTAKDEAGKLLCFLSGVAYANGGKLKKIANNTYIITPYNVDVMGDLLDELENNGMFFV